MKEDRPMASSKFDILMAGVGGQGTILASSVLGDAALMEGYDVKKSDVLGMSQRGGSVVSQIRLGQRVFSPLIKRGQADILVAFEKLEAARSVGHLRDGALAIVNDQAISPLSVSSGAAVYPSDDEIQALLRRRTERIYWVKGLELAEGLGNVRTLSVVLVGFLSAFLPLAEDSWHRALSQRIGAPLLDINMRAFALGRAAALQPG